MDENTPSPQTYAALLASIKQRIQTAQVRASLAVNRELVLLYWSIGKEILTRQQEEGWGKNIIPRLSKDLASQFPEMKGLSPRNLGYMKSFAEAWPDESILQQAAAKVPWFHNCIILDKVRTHKSVFGTSMPPSRMVGAETSSRSILKLAFTVGRRRQSPIFNGHYPRLSPISRSSYLKIPTTLIF